MRKYIVLRCVVLAVVAYGLLIGFIYYKFRTNMIYSCSGMMVDMSGNPVPEARVGIVTCGGEVSVSHSNNNGLWRIKGVPKNSVVIEHVAGYFVTHPNYIGISWSKNESIKKAVLEKPVSLKVCFKDFPSLKRIPQVYVEIEEEYKCGLSNRYHVSGVMPYPSPNRSQIQDGFEFSPLMAAPYKVTVDLRRQQTIVKHIDTRKVKELQL
jgi:hypothetical protein